MFDHEYFEGADKTFWAPVNKDRVFADFMQMRKLFQRKFKHIHHIICLTLLYAKHKI